MKILRVVSDIYPYVIGGLPIHAHELSRLQAKMGHDVTVFTANEDSLSQYEYKDGYSIRRFRSALKVCGNTLMPKLPVELYRHKDDFDVIHAHSHLFLSTNMCAMIKTSGSSPLVITNHGLRSQSVPAWLNDIFIPTVAKWTFKAADRIICYTENEKLSLVKLGIEQNKISVIHNGIDTEMFIPGKERKVNNRILWIGRFVPGKGVEYLIEAFGMLIKKYPELKLLMIGKGPLKDEMERKIKDMDLAKNVTIKEFIPNKELPKVYQTSDIFVLPSLEEGIPRTILEAMSCELPIVCTDLPQLVDIVEDCGILVPVKSSKALAESIDSILSDGGMAKRLGKNGRDRVYRQYSWDDTVRRTIELYKELT
ncbi:glycosyltransferase family 1 protein [Methanocella sp. CWC-04]|uniref:Glycosyltransferase family 1 protein n=1 Tax=Methanooceanicella nereidis TaxID=2052831 RepID=A0AAP2RDY1_9EURY|nr:glycosyltransferase family 4 protein [Methanocella sp. CWC-04]MCD1294875.1 glycosyltransferase family 1 protein [Methanocella sp. CWC-04]